MESSTFHVSPYAPANETAADLWLERSNINGAVLGGIAYGVHITLYFMCLSLLLKQWSGNGRRTGFFIAYISANFILGSIGNAANTRFNEMTFVDNRDYPGGPNAFFVAQSSYWFNVVGYGVYIANTWLQDGLLLYRFLVIWSFSYWVLVVPTVLYIVSIVMSCLLLAQLAGPGNSLWGRLSINFALTYWSISIATTVFVTSLIVGRLLFLRYRLRKTLGTSHNSPYLSLSSILIESAFLYSAIGLIFIITFGRNNAAQNLFLPVLGQVQSISPLLILLRVAQGKAWERDTLKETKFSTALWRTQTTVGTGTFALGQLESKQTETFGGQTENGPFERTTKLQALDVEKNTFSEDRSKVTLRP